LQSEDFQFQISNFQFPVDESPPVPPPSMYRGITTLITRYLYTGREYNIETGMYYYRARIMNPSHGRFTSKDRINYINLYTYILNYPLGATDPFGLILSQAECQTLQNNQRRLEKSITELEEKKATEGLTKEEDNNLKQLKNDLENTKMTFNNNCTLGGQAKEIAKDVWNALAGPLAKGIGLALKWGAVMGDWGCGTRGGGIIDGGLPPPIMPGQEQRRR
jgi:RHS repeat-associated protein